MRLIRYTHPDTSLFLSRPFGFQRSPWSGLETEIERLFETTLGDFAARTQAGHVPVDVYEDKDNAYVRAELPGVERDAIKVEVTDGILTLTANRKAQGADGEVESAFSRSLGIPENVQGDKASASYENGVLTVTLPKREETKPRRITVNVR
jgi:HSP20 family protein